MRQIYVIGLNHETSKIETRETFARVFTSSVSVRNVFSSIFDLQESVLLSTCNRVEMYVLLNFDGDIPSFRDVFSIISSHLSSILQLSAMECEKVLYMYDGRRVLHHLFRVSSSLDSMILGESQIVSQVRNAFQEANENKSIGSILHKSLEMTLRVSKRVRTETGISKESVSIGKAGVDLACQVLGDLRGRSAMVIGAGEHGKLVAKNLYGHGLNELIITNRTFDRAVELAKEFGAAAVPISELKRYLSRVDIVITSIGGGSRIISRKQISDIRKERMYQSLVLIDLSVPRVIDTQMGDFDEIFLFDVDDLAQLTQKGIISRRKAAERATYIIDEESHKCWRHLVGEKKNNQIGDVYRKMDQIREREIDRFRTQLTSISNLSPEIQSQIEDFANRMTKSLTKKIINNPIHHVKQFSKDGDIDSAEVILHSFLKSIDSISETDLLDGTSSTIVSSNTDEQ